MHSNLNRVLDLVLEHEGGFVDHPADPGGATNLGVTIANFRRYVKPGGTVADLKALTRAQAKTVYERQYWDAVRGSQLPSGVDYSVMDYGVNSGPKRAVKLLQRLVGVEQDGVIGPDTLRAVRDVSPLTLVQQYNDARLAWLRRLPTWKTFGKGWENRVNAVRKVASEMAS